MPSVFVVLDASALVELVARHPKGRAVADAIGESTVLAPALIDAETVYALRGLERAGNVSEGRARTALSRLLSIPIERVPLTRLVRSAWELRASISTYDAFYVALARQIGCSLITADLKLARADRLGVPVIAV